MRVFPPEGDPYRETQMRGGEGGGWKTKESAPHTKINGASNY